MLIRSLHGKQVYITKTTDSLATKLNHVSNNIRRIDTTFHEWEQHLNKYAGQQHCHFRSFLEYEFKHSALVSRMFAAMLRLNEIQNTLHELAALFKKKTIPSYRPPRTSVW